MTIHNKSCLIIMITHALQGSAPALLVLKLIGGSKQRTTLNTLA